RVCWKPCLCWNGGIPSPKWRWLVAMNPPRPSSLRSVVSWGPRRAVSVLRGLDDGVEVGHDIQNGFLRHDAAPGFGRNFMAGEDGQIAVHFEVDLHPDHVPHLARLETVDAQHAGGLQQ